MTPSLAVCLAVSLLVVVVTLVVLWRTTPVDGLPRRWNAARHRKFFGP